MLTKVVVNALFALVLVNAGVVVVELLSRVSVPVVLIAVVIVPVVDPPVVVEKIVVE